LDITINNFIENCIPRLSPYIDEINHQGWLRRKRSTADQIFCIRQILEKIWEFNWTVHQLFVDFKKAYDSVRREVLYSILVEFVVPMKQVTLTKMCLNETYNKVRIGKYLSDNFYIQMSKQVDALWPLIFNFALQYATRMVQEIQVRRKSNGTHELQVYADVKLLGNNIFP
jgi:hypothetical protein